MGDVKIGLGKDGAQAQNCHVGPNTVVCAISISASGTTSAGDRLLIGKLPTGAIPVDAVFYRGAAFLADGIWKMGTSASADAFIASGTFSALVTGRTIRGSMGMFQVSCSDDARVRYDYIVAVPAVAITAGVVGQLVVTYLMPGQTF